MLKRILLFLFVLAGLRVSAQHRSDVTLWSVGATLDSRAVHNDAGLTFGFFFEQNSGVGLSFNHYWTDHLSTELAVDTFRGDVETAATFTNGRAHLGDLNGRAISGMAQWHFLPGRRVRPYLSAGLAHISGDFDPDDIISVLPIDLPNIDLESEVTWTAAVGLDVNLTDHWALAGEVKEVPWNGVEVTGSNAGDEFKLDPTLFNVGVRYRF